MSDSSKAIDHDEPYYEYEGDQVVEVDSRYSYRWDGNTPLEIGDHVLVTGWIGGTQEGVVTGMGSTYRDDELSSVVRRVTPAEPELSTRGGGTTVDVENEVGERVGKLRFGRATVEWCPGRTPRGEGRKIRVQELIELLENR